MNAQEVTLVTQRWCVLKEREGSPEGKGKGGGIGRDGKAPSNFKS